MLRFCEFGICAPPLRVTVDRPRASPIGKDRQDFTVYCGDWPMGRIYEERGEPEHMRWFWTLYGVVGKPPNVHTNDHAPTLEEAKTRWRPLGGNGSH
jgi:hypothetical protein